MRLRGAAIGAALLASSAWPIAAPARTACASEAGPSAVLVVDTGERVSEFCVSLDANTVSGLHLIELAGEQHGLAYSLGFGGKAVCKLEGVGPAGDDCFAQYPDYWGYWHGDGSGGWSWASTGAGSYQVAAGAIEGWTWGSGDTGASHPAPPATEYEEVCRDPEPSPSPMPTDTPKPSPEPDPDPDPTSSPAPSSTHPSGTASGDGGPGGGSEPGGTSEPSSDGGPDGSGPDATPNHERTPDDDEGAPSSFSPSPSDSPNMGGGGAPSGGPPAGLIVAATMGLLLAAGGWLRVRAARSGSGTTTEVAR